MRFRRTISGISLFLGSSAVTGVLVYLLDMDSIYGISFYTLCVLLSGVLIGSGVSS